MLFRSSAIGHHCGRSRVSSRRAVFMATSVAARGNASMPLEGLSLFFPCRNEGGNLAALVSEALDALPALATRYEVIIVDDGSTDETPGVAAQLMAAHPGVVFLVRHEHGRGYGGALRSGFAAARMEQIAFTDGDRQFRVSDLAPLVALIAAGGEARPDAAVGYRIEIGRAHV